MTWPAPPMGNQSFQLLSAVPITDASPTNRTGTPIQTWSEPVTVTGVTLEPVRGTSSTETFTPIEDRVVTRWLLVAPADLVMTALDRARYGALRFEVDGDPALSFDLDGRPDHLTVYLKRVQG